MLVHVFFCPHSPVARFSVFLCFPFFNSVFSSFQQAALVLCMYALCLKWFLREKRKRFCFGFSFLLTFSPLSLFLLHPESSTTHCWYNYSRFHLYDGSESCWVTPRLLVCSIFVFVPFCFSNCCVFVPLEYSFFLFIPCSFSKSLYKVKKRSKSSLKWEKTDFPVFLLAALCFRMFCHSRLFLLSFLFLGLKTEHHPRA